MTTSKKPLTYIGTTELISFPDDAILNVPAKVDTGADSSAIWASDVMLEGGVLRFNFFAPGSTFYKPEPTFTTAFRSAVVKNSFGHREIRYKIRVKVHVGKRTFKTWFSLADRSNNTYPVLLGKTFLKGRFVVDVSKSMLVSTSDGQRDMLVLSNNAPANSEFFTQVACRMGEDVTIANASYNRLRFDINGAHTQIVNMADGGRDVSSYALTYFKSHGVNAEFAAAVAEYLHYKSRRFMDLEVASYTSASKLTETMCLATHNIRTPRSVVAKTPQLLNMYDNLAEELGTPFVLKEITSDRGRNNYLVSTKTEFQHILQNADKAHIYMAQQYISNEGFFRLYVMGREVVLAVWRGAHPHNNPLKQHLNKPAGSVNATKVSVSDVPSEIVHMAVMAADRMQRQIAGVDLVQDRKTKEWYVLEVNSAPQLRSGSFLNEKAQAIAEYFDKELNR